MNPFLDASLADLKAMLPDLSDPELDALCAATCDGEWVRWYDAERFILYRIPEPEGWYKWKGVNGTGSWIRLDDYKPTSDGREAMRLLVKYRLQVQWGQDTRDSSDRTLCVSKSLNAVFPIDVIPLISDALDVDLLELICRAITEAAVCAKLTAMMQ